MPEPAGQPSVKALVGAIVMLGLSILSAVATGAGLLLALYNGWQHDWAEGAYFFLAAAFGREVAQYLATIAEQTVPRKAEADA